MTVTTTLTSSLEKGFVNQNPEDFAPLTKISALRGERISMQLFIKPGKTENGEVYSFFLLTPRLTGELAPYVALREVGNVPVETPVFTNKYDEHFISTEPGIYPDVLKPLTYVDKVTAKANCLNSMWIDVTIPEGTELSGECPLTIELVDEAGNVMSCDSVTIDVIPVALPEQELILTQWFHCDSLANYYRVPVWSEEHWAIVESFARTAYKNGINLLLTPTFTPSLDTAIGGERLTNQLVGVTKKGDGYIFDFTLLDRWVDMCDRIGIKYFEIAHFFTQWGAKHAPKVMATVDGEYKKIFGWETSATDPEYTKFLRSFITEFLAHMKKNGNDKRCFFHISDEPQLEHLEFYKAAKASIADLLEGYPIMDALSHYEFYADGIVDLPIPVNDHIEPFIEHNVPNLWTYYCCGQSIGVSNRLIAMPSARNRSIGMQMFKYDIVGFLQWGYNFYNTQHSVSEVNPFLDVSGGHWVPAGDAFSVYPGLNGEALESLRILVFHDAIQDISAMKLCASLYSKEEVVKAIEEVLGTTLTFSVCAYEAKTMLAIRGRINEMIKARL